MLTADSQTINSCSPSTELFLAEPGAWPPAVDEAHVDEEAEERRGQQGGDDDPGQVLVDPAERVLGGGGGRGGDRGRRDGDRSGGGGGRGCGAGRRRTLLWGSEAIRWRTTNGALLLSSPPSSPHPHDNPPQTRTVNM